jgi:tetratricopeptide (TPR) repeat protein
MARALSKRIWHRKMAPCSWLIRGLLVATLSACQTAPQQPQPTPVEPEPVDELAELCVGMTSRELERQAIDRLDKGESREARYQLDCALEQNPRSAIAKNLIEQLEADPVAYLGRRSYQHTVKSEETLSKIAQERLGSSLKFVILARYNDIEVPANLVAGQVIRIPGEEPVEEEAGESAESHADSDVGAVQDEVSSEGSRASASVLHKEALSKEEEGNLRGAYDLILEARSVDDSAQGINEDLSRIKASLIGKLEEQAYTLELSGDLNEAVETWGEVLAIDPTNIPAQLSTRRLKAQLAPSQPAPTQTIPPTD